MAQVTIGDIDVYYEQQGEGHPLLLVGGLGLTVAEMRHLREGLAERFHVIAADNRGAGKTSAPPGPYTIEQMAADHAGVLGHLGLSKVHVVGISMGGRIALSLALDRPDLVEKLVLISTGPRMAGRRSIVRLGLAAARVPGLRGQEPQPRHAQKAQFDASTGFDATARLAEITQPTLVVHGKSDRVAPLHLAELMHDQIPGSQMTVLDGRHLISLMPRSRDKVLDAVAAFLA